MTIYSPMPCSYDTAGDVAKLNAYREDLAPAGEITRPCMNHRDRKAVALDSGDPLCMPCWLERRTQGAITKDTALILRAPLDPHERMILLRRAERR